jgi:Tfp pilus assembly protein PilO
MTKPMHILLAACLIASLGAALVYGAKRLGQIRELRAQTAALQSAERKKGGEGEQELLKRKFPAKADVSSFVEGLYTVAQRSGLQNVEISTVNDAQKKSVKKSAGDVAALTAWPIRISFEGRYRAVADYIRAIQGLERFKRLILFEMKPGKNAIKTNMIIEIMSIEVTDAA